MAKCVYDIDELNNILYALFDDEEKFNKELDYWKTITKPTVLFATPIGRFHNCMYKGQDVDYNNKKFIIVISFEKYKHVSCKFKGEKNEK